MMKNYVDVRQGSANDAISTVKCCALVGILSVCAACTTPSETGACAPYDGSAQAIQNRVMEAVKLGTSVQVLECISRPAMQQDYEEACLIEADPREAPELPTWDREFITFTPTVVRELADEKDVALAVVFTKQWNGAQLYADDDLSRSIVYRHFGRCGNSQARD
jgi:hypothetical protein